MNNEKSSKLLQNIVQSKGLVALLVQLLLNCALQKALKFDRYKSSLFELHLREIFFQLYQKFQIMNNGP